MRKIFIIIILFLCCIGCNKKEEIDIEQIMLNNDYIILDVRTEEEYNDKHIVDAINISYDIIDENINLDKDKVIFVYCRSGNRSKIAYNKLKELGYEVYDLHGIDEINLPKE